MPGYEKTKHYFIRTKLYNYLTQYGSHDITGNGVVPRLGTSLLIDGIAGGGKLVKDVEALQLGEQLALAERAGELRVPHPVGAVHLDLQVAATGEHRQVGGQLEMPRQTNCGVGTDIIVIGMDVIKVLTLAVNVIIVSTSMKTELIFIIGTVIQFQFASGLIVLNNAAHALLTVFRRGYVDTVIAVEPDGIVGTELPCLAERTGEIDATISIPISIDADGTCCATPT